MDTVYVAGDGWGPTKIGLSGQVDARSRRLRRQIYERLAAAGRQLDVEPS